VRVGEGGREGVGGGRGDWAYGVHVFETEAVGVGKPWGYLGGREGGRVNSFREKGFV